MKVLRPEVKSQKIGSGLFDYMDGVICANMNITVEELELLDESCTDEELDVVLLLEEKPSFSLRRKALEIRNKYVPYYGSKK